MVDGGIEGKLCAVSKKSRSHENIIENLIYNQTSSNNM